MDHAESMDGDRPGTCPTFHAAIELIGRRWNGVILQSLMTGEARFAELRRRIPGITDAMLSSRLRDLEQAGLLERRVSSGPPVGVHYTLTGLGVELGPVLDAIAAWGSSWSATVEDDARDESS